MAALVDAFRDGGLWMYIIVAWGGAFYALLTYQYVRRTTQDITWILWGLLASLALLGPLGSAVGIWQAGLAVARMQGMEAAQAVQLVSTYLGIALTTTIFSTMLAVIGAAVLGLVTHAVRSGAAPSRAVVARACAQGA
jgi:hypothetical protein